MPPRPAAPDRLHRSHEVELLATRFPGAKGRGDLVFFEGPKGGAAFSVGSIAWAAVMATDGYDNDVARLTTNVLRRVAVTIHELGAYIHELRESV